MTTGIRRMIIRFALSTMVALGLCAFDAVSPTVSTAEAQEVQISGPLKGAPAVKHLRLWRKKRLQLQPFFAFTLQNEYSRALLFGVQAKYHFTDWLGIGGWGAFSFVNLDTNLTDEVKGKGETRNRNRLSLPSREGFGGQIGEIKWMAGVDVNFVPLRGKISLFQKIFVDTDLSLFAGVAFVGVEERANVAAGVCDATIATFVEADCLATQSARASRVAVAPSFGVSLNAHFSQFMGISIQWRGIPFKWNTGGTDEGGSPQGQFPDGVIDSNDRQRNFNHMLSLGFVLYFPPKIKVTE